MESKVHSETVLPSKKTRKTISKSLKNNVWLQQYGEKFKCICSVDWCVAPVTPFTFEVGHNIPHSKGGTIDINNLRPICSTCNKSMGDRYTIDEFSKIANKKDDNICCIIL